MAVTNYFSVGGQVRSEKGANGYLYYARDNVGSVSSTHDTSGAAYNTYSYNPYGGVSKGTGPFYINRRFLWCGSWGYSYINKTAQWLSYYVRARHYSALQGMWNTKDPLWPREKEFGYADNNPTTGWDSSGAGSEIKMQIVRCPGDFASRLKTLCARVLEQDDSVLVSINKCINDTAQASNQKCQQVDSKRLKCYKNFCKSGYVECKPPSQMIIGGVSVNGLCPSFQKQDGIENPTGGIHITIDSHGSAGASNFASEPGEFNDGHQGRYTFLHEVGHACGVDHGSLSGVSCQCNDILACCMFEVLMGRKGSTCTTSIQRYLKRGGSCN